MKKTPEETGLQGPQWDLGDLYSGVEDPSIQEDLQKAVADSKAFQAAFKEKIISDLEASSFLQALQKYEAIQEEALKPFLYASLLFSEDSQNEAYKSLLQWSKEQWTESENHLLFFRLALIELPEERLQALLKFPSLKSYVHALKFLRRFRPFTRGEEEEEILNRKNLTGRSAFRTLFDEFTGSFTFHLAVEGEEKELTGSEVLALLNSPDRELREKSFRAFLAHHAANELVLTAIFNALLLDHQVEDNLRGYPNPMQQTHLENEILPEVVDRMMEVTETHYPLAQEYFQVKACLLGLPKLKNTDLYAPLPGARKKVTFGDSQEILLRSFQGFHPLFGEISEKFFTNRWIDAQVRKGKYGGAFCAGMTPSLHPVILMNFTGLLRDALTLAHEMGHAVHFYLARSQSLLNFDPPLVLAETASVFGEMIMTQVLLQEEKDLAVRQALLCTQIEDMIATVFRQNVLTRFEQQVYRLRQDHLLSSREMGDLWWEVNGQFFGDSVEMIPEYRWGWSYISHFIHSRFYCYSYTFGELVVLALFERYLEEGPSFLPQLIRILQAGRSESPDILLGSVGFNIHSKEFWEKGFLVIRRLLDELKSMGPWEKICLEGDGG